MMGKHLNRRTEILDHLTVPDYWVLREKWRTDQRIADNALFCHIQTIAKWKRKHGVYTQPYNLGTRRKRSMNEDWLIKAIKAVVSTDLLEDSAKLGSIKTAIETYEAMKEMDN